MVRYLANGRVFQGRRRAPDDGMLRGTRLALPVGVAARYASKLVALAHTMTRETSAAYAELFSHPDVEDYFATIHGAVAMDISPASQARILGNKLQAKFEQLFASAAKPAADDMVGQADAASAADMKRSLTALSETLSLNPKAALGIAGDEFAKAVVAENVRLFKSIPAEYFNEVQGEVLRSITTGKGLTDLQAFFETKDPEVARRAKNIALDQTHKAYNGFNKHRMQKAGVKAFEWVHSGGGLHPRPLHEAMSGKVYTFDKLPIIDERTGERGIPGQAINCKCTMVPVVKFEGDENGDDQDADEPPAA